MKTTTNKNAYISATAIFMLSYVIIVAVAYCKYFLFGSFDGVVTSEFYVALAGCAISTLLILVSLITYLIYSRSKLIEKTKTLLAICTSLIFTYALCIVTSSLNLYYMPVAFVAFVVGFPRLATLLTFPASAPSTEKTITNACKSKDCQSSKLEDD
ncbi:MAG: hypothetical protein IKD03_05945, partial [Clostridia bacterium]|nr:hypothetical protein [Clostridia bacterium]